MAGTSPKQLSNQRVSAKNISSSIAALIVHTVDESGAFVSPGAGSTQVSVKEIQTSSGASVMDSTNNSIGVTIRAGSASGTEYTDGDVDATIAGGAILFDNSSNTLRPVTLTRGLPVNVVAGSAASTTATVRQSTASDLLMEPRLSTANANSSAYLPVRLTDGSGFVAPSTVVTVSTGSMRVHQSTAADLNVTVAGYVAPSTTVTARQSTASDLLVEPRLSTANANSSAYLPVRLTDGSGFVAPSTVQTISTGSVRVHQSTAADLNVTVAGYVAPSTTVTVSTGSVRVHQSTAADLNVTVAGYSTVTTVSTGSVRVHQSTAADLQVTATLASTGNTFTGRVTTSSGGGVEGSTASPAHGAIGLHVRQVPSSMATFAASTVGATSTNTTLVSSAAGSRVKVYAFSVTSTVVANSTVSFRSSLATVLWPLVLGTGSSGAMGANLAVAPPAFLFATAAANALTFHTPSSGPEFHVAVSYFVEP